MNSQTITRKDFQVGQTAYIVLIELLEYRRPKPGTPVIIETKIDKVGRKFVTTNSRKYAEDPGNKYEFEGLIEQISFGHYTVLTPDRDSAERIVERITLTREILRLCDSNSLNNLSLETLRQLKALLQT